MCVYTWVMFRISINPVLLPSVMSTQCCKRLQKEKEEMCASFEEAMASLKGQHEEQLVQLENRYWPRNQKFGTTRGSLSWLQISPVFCVRLKSFYQREWDKVHQMYQEEADKCCMMMDEQVRTFPHMDTWKCAEAPSGNQNVLTDPIRVCQVERLRKQQQAERDNQEAIQTQRMDALKLHYETFIQGEEKAMHPYQ